MASIAVVGSGVSVVPVLSVGCCHPLEDLVPLSAEKAINALGGGASKGDIERAQKMFPCKCGASLNWLAARKRISKTESEYAASSAALRARKVGEYVLEEDPDFIACAEQNGIHCAYNTFAAMDAAAADVEEVDVEFKAVAGPDYDLSPEAISARTQLYEEKLQGAEFADALHAAYGPGRRR